METNNQLQYLFSYGTLQLEKVQLATFGRILKGEPDSLSGFKLEQLKITDEHVLDKSELDFHPIAIPSINQDDTIAGVLFEVSTDELIQSDSYEVSDYKRVEAKFKSGKLGWIYVINQSI